MSETARAQRSVVVAIGNEIVEGRTLNSNATWLSARLRRLGFETVLHLAVADVLPAIVEALRVAATRARVVLVTGGLGPTIDDITRDGAAALAGVPLVEHAPSWDHIVALFRGLGREPSANNRRQALFPDGAEVLPNPIGTAPGFRQDLLADAGAGESTLFYLPGIPREMQRIFEGSVQAALEGDLKPPGSIRAVRLNAFGVPESEADALLAPLLAQSGVWLGFNASDGILEVHLVAGGDDPAKAEQAVAAARAQVEAALGHKVFGEGEATLAEATLTALERRGLTLGLAESCTAGLAARELGLVPGASRAFVGGVVAYSNAVKERLLGVPEAVLREHGAVSEAVALAMAEGALAALGSDLAVAVTGVAGPSGGTPEKPVGTVWVAIAAKAGLRKARLLKLRGERALIQRLAALAALELARRTALQL